MPPCAPATGLATIDVRARCVPVSPALWRSELTDRSKVMMLVLEHLAGEDVHCSPTNRQLGDAVGKRVLSAHNALDELESAGWIRRIYRDAAGLSRAGVVLLRRASPDRPAADTEERIHRAETDLRNKATR